LPSYQTSLSRLSIGRLQHNMDKQDDSLTRQSIDTNADAPPPAYEVLASHVAEDCGDVTGKYPF
jgi:hypothetical protein